MVKRKHLVQTFVFNLQSFFFIIWYKTFHTIYIIIILIFILYWIKSIVYVDSIYNICMYVFIYIFSDHPQMSFQDQNKDGFRFHGGFLFTRWLGYIWEKRNTFCHSYLKWNRLVLFEQLDLKLKALIYIPPKLRKIMGEKN